MTKEKLQMLEWKTQFRLKPWITLMISAFLVTAIIFSLPSCRSTKKIQTAITKKDTTIQEKITAPDVDLKADSIRFIDDAFSRIHSNRIDFKTFSAKVKVNYEGADGKNYEFNAFIRMEKDRVIWVSIIAILGIEGFRAIITPDSVKVLNKQDKIVQLRSVNYLKEIARLPFDFQTLQDLLVGNPVFLDSNILYYKRDENGLSFLSVGPLFKHYLTLNPNDYTLKHSKLDDVDVLRARTCDLTYGDYEKRDTLKFSTYRKISVAEKSKLDIQMSFKQFNFNEPLSFPFNIPKNYKRK
ncbi:MAG: DUF4292 domain-containing protein [Bacteroidetes bacterium]|nr:MAG: DUF4292 domain-containing protein [Bacteroidota bacterium]